MGFSHAVTFRIFLPNIKSKTNDHIFKRKKLKGILHSKDPNACLVFYLEVTSPEDCITWERTKDFALLET